MVAPAADTEQAQKAEDPSPAATATQPPPVVPTLPATTSSTPTNQPAPNPAGGEGEIIVTGRPRSPADPLSEVNVQSFKAIQTVDKAVTGPVAMTYKKSVPGPIRSGLRNFLGNLQEPVVFLNYLLQFKPGKAAETVGRFAINSTIGAVGLFDVAKKQPFNLPHRNNGFGYTLGYYGVKSGPFLYLPLIGPTTVRDLAGRLVDLSVMPWAVGKPFSQPAYAIPTTVVRLIDERAEAEDEVQILRDSADPYATLREDYLRTRQAEIDALHGKHSDAGDAAPKVAPPAPEASPTATEPAKLPDAPMPDDSSASASGSPAQTTTEPAPQP
jgi:phospholipid-binding lipoprotein MlaA